MHWCGHHSTDSWPPLLLMRSQLQTLLLSGHTGNIRLKCLLNLWIKNWKQILLLFLVWHSFKSTPSLLSSKTFLVHFMLPLKPLQESEPNKSIQVIFSTTGIKTIICYSLCFQESSLTLSYLKDWTSLIIQCALVIQHVCHSVNITEHLLCLRCYEGGRIE